MQQLALKMAARTTWTCFVSTYAIHDVTYFTCNFRAILLTTRLKGINNTNTPTPARIDGPIASYKKYKAIRMVSGEDQRTFA